MRDYYRHVPDTWITLDGRARRPCWLWIGVVGLVIAGITAATYLPRGSAVHPSHLTAAGHWWWSGVFGSSWLAYCIYMVNLGYGRTKLSRDGMHFHTFFSRRFIAWGEITRVQEWTIAGRSPTDWSYIGVRIAGGRTERHVPGTLTLGSGARAQKVLGQKLETIRSYWKNATDQDRGLR
jgi:hypothetical protein